MTRVTGTCPLCGKPFNEAPTEWWGEVPVGATCSNCNARMSWSPDSCWLSEFVPLDAVEGEVPNLSLTVEESKP